jgi:hypothetical protein
MALRGRPEFAEGDDKAFGASPGVAADPRLRVEGNVPPYTDNGKIQLRFLLNAEDEGTYPIEFSKHFVKLHLAGGSFSHLT